MAAANREVRTEHVHAYMIIRLTCTDTYIVRSTRNINPPFITEYGVWSTEHGIIIRARNYW